MDPAGPREYQVLSEILISHLAGEPDADAKAQAAGRAWGRRLERPHTAPRPLGTQESSEHLVELLGELGFAPERGDDEMIGLRHCPFLDLVESQRSVVCPIHLGLMQGALENWDAPVTVDRLDAFVEPDLCLAHLTQRAVTT
jgi:predicted ArsR family transcriptional regulator